MKQLDIARLWRENVVNILFCVLALIGMEWLFTITKPSFLSLFPLNEKLAVLPVSVIFLTAVLILLSIPLVLLAVATKRNKKIAAFLISIIPAFIFACLGILLVDNFTYTLFKIGIVSSSGIGRVGYLLGFVFLFGYLIRTIQVHTHKALTREWQLKYTWFPIVFTISTIILSGLIFLPFVFNLSSISTNSLTNNNEESLPNIILLTPDGVNASNLSIYGYERRTTPFLDSIKGQLLISDNHFTVSGNTSGSITSILTSKLPTTTRVLYPPDLLRGADTIEHLPAILRENGYYVAQFGVQHFVDAVALNFQNGFNEVNGASMESYGLAYQISHKFPSNSKLFLQEVESRLVDRLGHIFFIKAMENTYVQITQTQKGFSDLDKINQAVSLISGHKEPVFAHVHLMGTHGSKFYPTTIKFSEGIDRATQEPWDQDLYDDALVDFDSGVANLYEMLNEINELDNTFIIITSDHGQQFTTKKRLPLLILPTSSSPHLNNPEKNTQNIDIAPTILDMINVPKPVWMQGHSFFETQEIQAQIISTGTISMKLDEKQVWETDLETLEPPFYQFDYISLIDCDRIYQLDLENYVWTNEKIQDYHGVCSEDDYLPSDEIRTIVIERLQKDKFEFEVSSIPAISTDWIEFVNVNNQMAETVFKNILKSGWSEPESWGTWSLGNQSNLSLPLTYLDPRDYWFVTLLVQPLVLEGHPSTSLSIDVDGRNLWSGELTQTSKIRLPLILLEGQTTIDIGLFVDNPESPLRLGVSGDDRLLGLGLIGYQFSK